MFALLVLWFGISVWALGVGEVKVEPWQNLKVKEGEAKDKQIFKHFGKKIHIGVEFLVENDRNPVQTEALA